MQRTAIKRTLFKLAAVPTVGLIALYGADAAAPLVGKGRAHRAVAPVGPCSTSEQVVAEHGRERLFGDGIRPSHDVRGTVPRVDLTGSFQISNLGSDPVLALQGHREPPPHVFVDAAHLTPGGNAIAAELIARKILGSP